MRHEETRDNTTAIEANQSEADAHEDTRPFRLVEEGHKEHNDGANGYGMTDSEAITFVRNELEMTLDDDYPDKMEWLIDELMEDGFSEEVAEELVYGPGGIGH